MRRTKTLGLVITTIANHFIRKLSQGIETTARSLGYNIILCRTNYELSAEKQYIDMLRSKGVDGIIFTSAHMGDPNILGLAEEGFPIILVNRRTYHPTVREKVDSVGVDNILGGFLAVEHLIKLGHKRIGVIGGSSESSLGFERLEGGKKALLTYHLEVVGDYFIEGDFLKGSGYQGGKKYLKMSKPPTGIFATNDYMAHREGDAKFFQKNGAFRRSPHADKNNPRAGHRKISFPEAQLRDLLAAERSAEMAQKHQHQPGSCAQNSLSRLTVLSAIVRVASIPSLAFR